MKLDSIPLRAITMVAFLGVLTSASLLRAADDAKKAADPLAEAFFPPELILLARQQIALTPEQQTAVAEQVEKTQSKSTELQAQLKREAAALATIAKQDRVDEKALLAQLDKLLDVEREAKHLHLGMVVAIKNLLTPEQQAQLRQIAADGAAQLTEDLRNRLTEKVSRVERTAQEWADSGRDVSLISKTMEEKVKPLLDAGKALEAEAELDHLLEQLRKDQ